MNTDFDVVVDRVNTDCLKYDFTVERGLPADVLPLWVADMDFRASEPIIDALHSAVSHGIFGYSDTKSDYFEAVAGWFERHFDWHPEEDWLVKTPGVVYAIVTGIRAVTKPGECVIIQPPVYYPFSQAVLNNDRTLIENELVYRDGVYTIDFEDFERKIVENHVKAFLLCSPHNPVGRVWTRSELETIGAICLKNDVVVISDEIHCDFTYPGHEHIMFLQACPELAGRTIVCTAPSKTFNLAGLQVSNIWIPSDDLRSRFQTETERNGYSQLNNMGLIACKAAYEKGDRWSAELGGYLADNLGFLRDFLRKRLPEIRLVEPEGTYLVWLDCSGLGLTDAELNALITHKAKLWLDGGGMFGGDAGQFERINIACPRGTLAQALQQLEQAVVAHRS